MPVYEYLCYDCNKQFEISQSMHDIPINTCPEGEGNVRRIISGGSGFILKNTDSGSYLQPRCGKTQTCCESKTPCEAPSCEHGE